MRYPLVLTAVSLLLVARGAAEDHRFLILGKQGQIIAGPVASKGLPDRLQAGQVLAWTSLQESWHEDFHEILACRGGREWNLKDDADDWVRKVSGTNNLAVTVVGLPIKSGIVLLLEKGEGGQTMPAGIFRCFPATDPSGLFDKIPRGDYLLVVFSKEGYGGAKEVRVHQPWSRVDWRTLKDAKGGKAELLPVIRSRVAKEGKLEGGPLLDPESI